MFFEPGKPDQPLRHSPFKAIVSPRPVGWITSMNAAGAINLAPYSFFNGVGDHPPMVMFASDGRKDSLSFIAETGEFVCSLATYDLREQMNQTSATYPRGMSEMEGAGLAPAPSRLVRPPRVGASPCALECRLLQIVNPTDLSGKPSNWHTVFGQVIGIHLDERFVRDGRLDTAAMKPIARCGYDEYAVVDRMFTMTRPTDWKQTGDDAAQARAPGDAPRHY